MKQSSGFKIAAALCGMVLLSGCEPKQEPLPTGPAMPASPPGNSARRPSQPPSAAESAKRIKTALAGQQWRLQIKDLKIDVEGNAIFMRGSVKTEYLKNQAGNVAGPQSGGLPFTNELVVSK